MNNKSTIVRLIRVGANLGSALAPGLAARWLERLFLTPRRFGAPAREAAWLADAIPLRLTLDDRVLQVYTWGQGPLVVLVHGWAGRGAQLGAFVQPLVARGFRVVAVDTPAHGGSDGSQTALPEFGYALERVVAAFGPAHAVIAHSAGTAGTSMALAKGTVSPERVVYIAPPNRPEAFLQFVAEMLGFSASVAELARVRIEERFQVRLADIVSSSLASDIDVPLLVVHDPEDREVPYSDGEKIVSAWRGATLHTAAGLGHHRILRDRSVVAAVVAFVGDPSPVRLSA